MARDERIDRAISWGLTASAGVALSVGAWALTSLTSEVHGCRDDLARIGTRVAVIEAAHLEEKNAALAERMRLAERELTKLTERKQ